MSSSYLCLLLLVGLLANQITAQDSSTTSAPPLSIQYCNESSNMAFDIEQISGTWYELARNPAPSNSLLCAQLNITALPNNFVNISFTYSNTATYPWVNQTMYSNVTVDANNTAGYNISFTMYGKSYPLTTYKVLDTNYNNYTFVCGYTNISDYSTFFGVVLTRERILNSSILTDYESMAEAKYGLFSTKSMTTISQTAECSSNKGVAIIQMVSSVVAFFFAAAALLV
ncbi:PREDICTED: uncharacterized protein LOC108363802 [Rhagoletis zephyria]|uniref:uncharacterized protein LOC108363802 n=1 Tax=Rhagoletis zephyria TaxID=28612 RepID=UPI0008117F75|nr:PREDICTED: uncharacterized protein LOC108363802 [Rhagoletis zephyria]XP_017472779.1 PREDICTED: uncharacterized protein LOC108363802 [Rhagoletis zephyria]